MLMEYNSHLSQLQSMYPSESWMFDQQSYTLPSRVRYCSVYGYSYGISIIKIDGKTHTLETGQYFALSVDQTITVEASDKLFLVARLGYRAPNQIGWVESQGRLSYIDGCSDSLLVYPARMGDGSLSMLYFPRGIEQSFHRHPSIRLGCVISGHGISEYGEIGDIISQELTSGTSFCLSEHERHRFKTTSSHMTVIAYHPDGDWGPTDHNHTMLNRTYLSK